MIDHGRALTLAATSIDFPLDPAEQAKLDSHLRECAGCRTVLADLRGDAARLAALTPIAPPSWVRGALGAPRRSKPFVLLAAAAFLITATGLALVVGTRLMDDRTTTVLPSSPPEASAAAVVVPSHAPSQAPSQAPSPSPRPFLVPAGALAWEPVESTGGGAGSVDGVLTFQGAYIAYGADAEGVTWVSRSIDGRQWETVTLGKMVSPCPGYVPRSDSSIYAAATDGQQVILTGIETAMDITPCDTSRAVAWISSDGLTWQRSQGFGAINGFAGAQDVWAVPGGWETLVTAASGGPTRIWRSTDGLQWRWVSELDPGVSFVISPVIAAAADGTRVMALYNGEIGETIDGLVGGESVVRTSTDGRQWTTLDLTLPPGRGVSAIGILPPGPIGPNVWMLVTVADEEPPITWVSSDLQDWAQGTFPRDEVVSVVSTRYGFIATGDTLCGVGGACSADPAQYLSTDGLNWTPFTSSVDTYLIVDGPAGVFAFAGPDFRVWQLRSS
ncbi:MAG: hypothetical protein ABIZ52_01420 [Candidatus Limnocylindrales bacterium]